MANSNRKSKPEKVAPKSVETKPVTYSNEYKPKRGGAGKWVAGCCAILIFLLSFGANVVLGILFAVVAGENWLNGDSGYTEVTFRGDGAPHQKIVMIDLQGVMANGNEGATLLGENEGVGDILNQIQMAMNDAYVGAIVLNVDSPGGTVTAAEDLFQKVEDAKEAGIHVVTYIHGTGASGAYYGTCASDYIYANPVSITGSIGVIIQAYNYEELMKKVGVSVETYKSGTYKDILSGSRETTAEEQEIVQEIVNSSFEIFLDRVSEGRDIEKDVVRKIADGRIYSATQAVENGLVDEVGYEEDAIEKAASLADFGSYDVVRYEREANFLKELGSFPFGVSASFLKNIFSGQSRTLELFYL